MSWNHVIRHLELSVWTASAGFASLVHTITVAVRSLGLSLYIHFPHISTSCHGTFSPEAFKQSALYSWIASCLNTVCARSLVTFLHGCVIFQWVSFRFSRVSLLTRHQLPVNYPWALHYFLHTPSSAHLAVSVPSCHLHVRRLTLILCKIKQC